MKFLTACLIVLSLGHLCAIRVLAEPDPEPTFSVFPPTTVFREQGPTRTETFAFQLPSIVRFPFMLVVQNGDSSGSRCVSSATITLNGVSILRPSDFNQNISRIERPVDLISDENVLTARLAGAPGGMLTVEITGHVLADTTQAEVTSIITPSGGTIILEDVATLHLPAESVDTETSIHMALLNSPVVDLLASSA